MRFGGYFGDLFGREIYHRAVVLSETFGLGEDFARTFAGYRVFVEALAPSDAAHLRTSRVMIEWAGLGDGVNKTARIVRADGVGVNEERTLTAARVFSEGLTPGEKIRIGPGKILTETLKPGEAFIRSSRVFKHEGLSAGEVLVKETALPFTEGVGVGEGSFYKAPHLIRLEIEDIEASVYKKAVEGYMIETLTLVDVVDYAIGFAVILTEALGLTDGASKDVGRVFFESLGLGEVYERAKAMFRTFVEDLTTEDHLAKSWTTTMTEGLGVMEVHPARRPSKLLTDPVGVSEFFARTAALYRVFVEVIEPALMSRKSVERVLVDGIFPVELFERTAEFYRVLSEDFGLADGFAKHAARVFEERPEIAEAFDKVGEFYRLFVEAVGTEDGLAKSKEMTLKEFIEAIDELKKRGEFFRAFIEALGMDESISEEYKRGWYLLFEIWSLILDDLLLASEVLTTVRLRSIITPMIKRTVGKWEAVR